MSDNRPIVYANEGTVYYRVSGFASCEKALTAARMGLGAGKPSKKLQEAYDAGHKEEDTILAMFEHRYGENVFNRQLVVEREISPNIVLRGSIDGRTLDTIIDAKYLAESSFRQFEARGFWASTDLAVKYATQGLLYLWAMDDPKVQEFALFIKSKKHGDHILVEATYDELKDILGIEDVGQWVAERCATIEQRAKDADLDQSSDCSESWGCPYYYLHGNTIDALTIDSINHLSGAEQTVLDQLATEYEAITAEERKVNQRKKEVRDLIAAFISRLAPKERKVKYQVANGTVSKTVTTRTTYNYRKMESDGIDLAPYRTTKESTAIRFTPKGEDNE